MTWILFVIALFVGSFLSQILIFGLSIWGSAKILRVPGTTWGRAIKIGLIIAGIFLVVSLVDAILTLTISSKLTLALALLALVLYVLVTIWMIVKRRLQCSHGKAAAITAIALLFNVAFSFPLVWAMRRTTEAFVIPTGSMATTIIGRHSHIKCQNCGLEFDVSAPNRTPEGNPIAALAATEAICPNCFQSTTVPIQAPILSSDRFVIEKLAAAKRWDNVAYWAQEPLARPRVAYCKRLVGLPNESLAIVDGDVFIDGHRLVKKPDELLDLWIPVDDTNFVARVATQSVPSWQATDGSSWKLIANRWKYSSVDNSEGSLTFNGLINDWLSYNLTEEGRPRDEIKPVGDFRVDCDVASFSGTGSWGILWHFAEQIVQCRITAQADVELSRRAEDDASAIRDSSSSSGHLVGDLQKPQIISLAIRDGWSYVLQNGHPVASLKTAPENLVDVHEQADLKPGNLSLFASQCDLEISQIKISRDVYYTQPLGMSSSPYHSFSHVQLGEKEIFLLGDNSQRSSDSRYQGPSSIDDIIGVVRWCYWPLSRWRTF
jgi:type IV secretory pathway protease TraF